MLEAKQPESGVTTTDRPEDEADYKRLRKNINSRKQEKSGQ